MKLGDLTSAVCVLPRRRLADGQHSSVQVGGKATLAGSVVHVGANGTTPVHHPPS